MAVVGHAIQVIIDLALLVMRVDRHVQAMRMKRLAVQQHKPRVFNARNLPIPPSPRLQDAAGVVILDITKVVIIALLALRVQQDSMNQKLYIHKIVNVVYHAPQPSNSEDSGQVDGNGCIGDAKWAIIRMETRARNVHQNAKIMVQQESNGSRMQSRGIKPCLPGLLQTITSSWSSTIGVRMIVIPGHMQMQMPQYQ